MRNEGTLLTVPCAHLLQLNGVRNAVPVSLFLNRAASSARQLRRNTDRYQRASDQRCAPPPWTNSGSDLPSGPVPCPTRRSLHSPMRRLTWRCVGPIHRSAGHCNCPLWHLESLLNILPASAVAAAGQLPPQGAVAVSAARRGRRGRG